jgi:hypothetical protein
MSVGNEDARGDVRQLAGVAVLVCAADGAPVAAERDAADLVGQAMSNDAQMVALPVARLSERFLDLSTRLAGEVLQKLVTYGLRVAIVGDVSQAAARSSALRDFVRESNRGRHVWFVADLAELEARLAGGDAPAAG